MNQFPSSTIENYKFLSYKDSVFVRNGYMKANSKNCTGRTKFEMSKYYYATSFVEKYCKFQFFSGECLKKWKRFSIKFALLGSKHDSITNFIKISPKLRPVD